MINENSHANKILLGQRRWRLENLYRIVDKQGNCVPFKFNWAQQELNDSLWYCNIVLKCRQIGSTTFFTLLLLDAALFNSNTKCGVIAHTLEDAKSIFKRIKFAYESLPVSLKKRLRATTDSVRELQFSNGSSIRVGTSMRSDTMNFLLVSEFGKMCAQYPGRAQEVISGSLNAVAPGQFVVIESTAEGRDGPYYTMVQQALKDKKKNLTKLDYKIFFFPWWRHSDYHIEDKVLIPKEQEEYFSDLEKEHSVKLIPQQKWWYVRKHLTQQDSMKSEYPSHPDEAFEVSNEGAYYAKGISVIRERGHIGNVPYQPEIPVHTSWDLGYSDYTAIWYFQVCGKEIHLIDYDEFMGESMQSCISVVKKKPYTYGTHLGPHDLKVHEYTSGLSRLERARQLALNFTLTKNLPVQDGIDNVRNLIFRCWFDEKNCSSGLRALENYSKSWNERLGCWSSTPKHDDSSHGADSFRYLANGINLITHVSWTPEDLERSWREAIGVKAPSIWDSTHEGSAYFPPNLN